jgi:hypothetical protein
VAHTVILGDSAVVDISPMAAEANLGANNAFGNVYANGQFFIGGLPVSYMSFSQFSTVTVSNTTALTSLTTGSSQTGSLTIPVSTVGMQMVLSGNMQAVAVASATLTLSLYIGGSLALAFNALTIPGSSAVLTLTVDMVVHSGVINILAQPVLAGVTPNPISATVAYTPGSSNVFDLRATWSAANSGNVLSVFGLRNVVHGLA